jgi:AcrR family transcriptional regulator
MGSKERRQRHRAQVRQAILVAARELFVAKGTRNVSLRHIAERLDYSPAALYSYFRSKDDIFVALAEEDAAVLDRQVYEATRHEIDPIARIRRTLWTLYESLNANPLLLEVLILDNSVARMNAGRHRFECFHGIAAGMEADVAKCIERGQMSGALTPTATRQLLWVGMLGAATLAARRACGAENCDVLAGVLLETLLAGVSIACRQVNIAR